MLGNRTGWALMPVTSRPSIGPEDGIPTHLSGLTQDTYHSHAIERCATVLRVFRQIPRHQAALICNQIGLAVAMPELAWELHSAPFICSSHGFGAMELTRPGLARAKNQR